MKLLVNRFIVPVVLVLALILLGFASGFPASAPEAVSKHRRTVGVRFVPLRSLSIFFSLSYLSILISASYSLRHSLSPVAFRMRRFVRASPHVLRRVTAPFFHPLVCPLRFPIFMFSFPPPLSFSSNLLNFKFSYSQCWICYRRWKTCVKFHSGTVCVTENSISFDVVETTE